jgi:hypothetical protein
METITGVGMEMAALAGKEYVVERVDEGTPSRGPDNPNIVFGPDTDQACQSYVRDADAWSELNSPRWHRVIEHVVRTSFDNDDD